MERVCSALLGLGLLGCAGLSFASGSSPLFVEVAPESSGITWRHENARSPEHYLPETLGPGCVFFDYDLDGWVDIYLVNSGPADFFQPRSELRNALYRNNADGTFSEVSERAGVAGGDRFGMGAAAGDYDNDGDPDLFLTAYGSTRLYRNNGDGTFTDVTEAAGLSAEGWTTSAAWFDYDDDGWLDLFVCSFIQYGRDQHVLCGENRLGKHHYCIPRMFEPTPSLLFHNQADGSFQRATGSAGAPDTPGKALGVVATDVDNDGRLDLFVANDTEPNYLFLNQGGGRWQEAGLWAGVAYDIDGQARSGMGVDAADLNEDGWQDLFVANVDNEMSALYLNNRGETFLDGAVGAELGRDTFLLSGWGLKFFDFDDDGDLDLILANGHPDDMIDATTSGVSYEEPLLLFQQEDNALRSVSAEAGPVFSRAHAARGLAAGDYDNDGRIDVVVGVNGGAPLLLHNVSSDGHNWVGLRLQGRQSNRDGIGARIAWSAGGVVRHRFSTGGGSYLSSHDARFVLGLGSAARADWVEVTWPDGRVDRLKDCPTNVYIILEEGF